MSRQMAAKFIAEKFSNIEHVYKDNTRDYIVLAYSEPHRTYHDETHIADMLQLLDRYQNTATRPDLITHAIFWHDVVYTTRDTNGNYRPDALNVQESADAFLGHVQDMEQKDHKAVSAMIMATSGHDVPQFDAAYYKGFTRDTALFLDLDLSSMATPWDKFWNNTKAIRQEYDWIDKDVFCKTRADILEKFLGRDHLYHVVPDREIWDNKARDNLGRSIQKLRHLEL